MTRTVVILPPRYQGYTLRTVIDNDGDVEIRTEDNGRFSLLRRVSTDHPSATPLYQLIGNYAGDWSVEIEEEVTYE